MGPDSPARKLDFGTPKNAVSGRVPLHQLVEEKVVSSSEIKFGTRSRSRNREADEDCFLISSPPPSQPLQFQPRSQGQPVLPSSSSGSSSQHSRYLDFLSAPRDLPPVDPQSEHYPGFTVYQDPHILIPTLRITSPAFSSTPATTLAPLDNNFDSDSDAESIDSRELVKENFPPRRRVRKAPTAPLPERPQLFSPPSAKSSSVPATPPREYLLRERETSMPRRLSIFGVGVGSGPGKAQYTPSKEDQHNMRRILEEEVDGEQGDD